MRVDLTGPTVSLSLSLSLSPLKGPDLPIPLRTHVTYMLIQQREREKDNTFLGTTNKHFKFNEWQRRRRRRHTFFPAPAPSSGVVNMGHRLPPPAHSSPSHLIQ